MKSLTFPFRSIFLAALALTLAVAPGQTAGNPNSIWLSRDTATLSDGQPLRVTVMANSNTDIQGFSFKLAYDPTCLTVQGSQIRLQGLANMSMKQPAGAVEGIYTSTQPLTANGAMVDVLFAAAQACDTSVALESASLMALDENRIAVGLPGITVDNTLLPLSTTNAASNPANAQSIAVLDDPNANLNESSAAPISKVQPSPTPAAQEQATQPIDDANANPGTLVSSQAATSIIAALVLLLIGIGILALWLANKWLQGRRQGNSPARAQTVLPSSPTQHSSTPVFTNPVRANAGMLDALANAKSTARAQTESNTASAYITIQRGIQAGTRIRLANFPCNLGNSPANEVALEDPSIAPFHAKIYRDKGAYTLVDLGNSFGTYVNGRFYQNQLVPLASGDVIKIGSIIMVFTVH